MNIKEARRHAGLSQAELGMRVGLDQSGISRIENGTRPLTVELLKAIANVLRIAPSELLVDEMRERLVDES